MSANESRHEDAPKNIDERLIFEERPSWIETPENGERVALAQERVLDQVRAVDHRFEIASGAALERDETCERLLGAIGGTEIARSMRGSMPADPHAPACAEPPQKSFAAARARIEPSASEVHAAPAASPSSTPRVHPAAPEPGSILEKDKTRYRMLHAIRETEIAVHLAGEIAPSHSQLRHLVQTSPESASVPLMPPAAASRTHPAPPPLPERDSVAEDDKTRDRLLHAISGTILAGHLRGEITASHSQARHLVRTSPESASVPLIPAAATLTQRPVSETREGIRAESRAVVPEAPLPPQPVAVESAQAPLSVAPAQDRSPASTILAWYRGGKRLVGVKLAPIMKRALRAMKELSIQFKACVETKAAPAMKHLGRSAWQFSARFEKRVVANTALAMKSTSRAATQLSIQFKNWLEKKAVPAMERLGRSVWQILTGLDDFAHSSTGAQAMGSTGQSRTQLSTWLEKWFDPRQKPRLAKPPVVAYCWTADTPLPVKIADISSSGIHLVTEARWPRGGVLSMTLQRTDRASEIPGSWIVIDFRVIRLCNDGVAGAFIPSTQRGSSSIPSRAENCADSRTLKSFVSHLTVAGMT